MDTLGIPKGSFYDVSADENPSPDANKDDKLKRKGGAPLGNQNARKHGLYSKLIPPRNTHKFHDAVQTDDLSNEIAFLRLKLDSLINDPDADLEKTLKVISILARLVNIQRRYTWRWPPYRPDPDEEPHAADSST